VPSTDRKLELKAKTSVAQTGSQAAVHAKGLRLSRAEQILCFLHVTSTVPSSCSMVTQRTHQMSVPVQTQPSQLRQYCAMQFSLAHFAPRNSTFYCGPGTSPHRVVLMVVWPCLGDGCVALLGARFVKKGKYVQLNTFSPAPFSKF
jgi:hypothetical protein